MTQIVLATALLTGLIVGLTLVVIAARSLLVPAEAVAITVNGGREIPATTGEKLLGALHRAGIPLPSPCAGSGICGLCRVVVGSSAGEPLATELARLDRGLIRQGVRLACQVVVRAPLDIRVPEDILSAESWKSPVLSTRMLAPLIKEIVLDVPRDQTFEFRPGAFVQVTRTPPFALSLGDVEVAQEYRDDWSRLGLAALAVSSAQAVSRAYSIASAPDEAGRIVLNIRLAIPPPSAGPDVAPGIVSSYLFGLGPGDEVSLAGPFGDFHVRDSDREMIVIGGGVGMAPLRAIITDQLRRATTRPISFWYGARSLADLFYREEFDRLAATHANFNWTVALSDPAPQDNWPGATGFIHDVLLHDYLKDHPAPEACEYYLCGPPLMIRAVLNMLDGLGVDQDMIFNDDFGS